MDEEELKEEIKKSKGNGRYYERLIAMKLFSKGNKLSDIADKSRSIFSNSPYLG